MTVSVLLCRLYLWIFWGVHICACAHENLCQDQFYNSAYNTTGLLPYLLTCWCSSVARQAALTRCYTSSRWCRNPTPGTWYIFLSRRHTWCLDLAKNLVLCVILQVSFNGKQAIKKQRTYIFQSRRSKCAWLLGHQRARLLRPILPKSWQSKLLTLPFLEQRR